MPRNVKPIIRLARADEDVQSALDYYLNESVAAATGFIDTIETAYQHIQRAPASGSPRYAHELNLPGLRSWSCARYPFLVFYFEHSDQIDIWRVLHQQRDIPPTLQALNDSPI